MDLTHQHLEPIFESIVELLGSTPGQLERFEPWATEQAVRLRSAATAGPERLLSEAELMRSELAQMKAPPSFERMITERTERMRLCQRLWLTGLLDFVDDLVEGPPEHDVPWVA